MTFPAQFPFTLTVKNADRFEKITCLASLRKVPGNREVFDGLSGDRPVIIKLFFDPRRAGVHREREWKGLKRLQSLGVKTPAPLFYGQDKYCRQVIIIEKIQHASTLKELCAGTDDSVEKMEWLRLLFRELADYHLKGILQQDLHLGNFMLKDLELITLDPAQMKFQGKPVGRRQAITQLALLCSRIDGIQPEMFIELCRVYGEYRNWEFSGSELATFQKQLSSCRRTGIRKTLKKYLRSNTRHLSLTGSLYSSIIDREFCRDVDPIDLVNNIDQLIDNGQPLIKGSHNKTVTLIHWNNTDLVLRKYHHAGVIKAVKHVFTKTPACRYWLNSHRLRLLNLLTPMPIAFIEKGRKGFPAQSYIITEYLGSSTLYDFLEDTQIEINKRIEAARRFLEFVIILEKNNISHCGLSPATILYTDNGPCWVGLDGMRNIRPGLYAKKMENDRVLFRRYWFNTTIIAEIFTDIWELDSQKF